MRQQHSRYSAVALGLHGGALALIIGALAMGSTEDAAGVTAGGVAGAILALSLFRLAWRVAHPSLAEAQPAGPWGRGTARFVQIAFYGLVVGIPLLAWAGGAGTPAGPPEMLLLLAMLHAAGVLRHQPLDRSEAPVRLLAARQDRI